MRHGIDQSLAAWCPAVKPSHVGLDPGFINENKPARGQARLLLAPLRARLGDVCSVLLSRSE
jgi:hypothetical protein